MSQNIWKQPQTIGWTQILLDSFHKLLGYELIERNDTPLQQAKALFFAPFALVSHGTEEDPILKYGNQVALKLWEMSWEEFTRTPSRLTAEPINQEERQKILLQVTKQGYVDRYRGVRISSTGKRFVMENAIIWNLFDTENKPCGQAATFSKWIMGNG